jgi:hypothetical protein
MAEQRTHKPLVVGSNPIIATFLGNLVKIVKKLLSEIAHYFRL